MGVLFYISLVIFLMIAVLLCLVVLVQESKSLGLGASFGGDPGESMFGTSTAAVLKKFTAWLGVCFLIGCILLSTWSESAFETVKEPIPVSIESEAGA